jgi:hypothetical protein
MPDTGVTRRSLLLAGAGTAAGYALGQPASSAAAPPRMAGVTDLGPVLRPSASYDRYGIREAILFSDPARPGRLLAHYDGCGTTGWLACLAYSDDGGRTWVKRGPVLRLGPAGSPYAASASSPWVRYDNGLWHMFYLGAGRASGAPDRIPMGPYQTLRAQATSPYGPWAQAGGVLMPGSPGPILRWGGQWVMFASGAGLHLATTRNLRTGPWVREQSTILPREEGVENVALWWDRDATGLWWLLTNRIRHQEGQYAYTDAVVAYWGTDPLTGWSPARKVVVLDQSNTGCPIVGMPSVLPWKGRMLLAYDARPGPIPGAGRWDHMARLGRLALVDLPLAVA